MKRRLRCCHHITRWEMIFTPQSRQSSQRRLSLSPSSFFSLCLSLSQKGSNRLTTLFPPPLSLSPPFGGGCGGRRLMASSRSTNNKYASLNFNDIYQKKHHPSSSSSSSPSPSSLTSPKTVLSNSRIHGNMLVLTRPAPKPIPQPSPPPTPPQQQPQTQQPPETPDPISLRPLGRTGSGPTLIPSPLTLPKPDKDYSPSPKSGRFVPPHLRPGFVGREEKPGPLQGARSRENLGYGEEGRPKSGGGYDRVIRGGGESDLVEMNRPGSSGNRPNSSG